MLKTKLTKDLEGVVKQLGYNTTDIVLSIPENPDFGDYSSNIALKLANQKSENGSHSPHEIANTVSGEMKKLDYLADVSVAGPGFVNFKVKDQTLLKVLEDQDEPLNSGKKTDKVLLEYGQPNTHKELHIGHLRTLFIGEAIARLLEQQGDQVFRVSYGSDIGPTVAKALWGISQLKDEYDAVKQQSLTDKAHFLGKAYALGHKNYADPSTKDAIDGITAQLYQKDPSVVELWKETRQWSLDYFKTVFDHLGTDFDRIVTESEVEVEGKKIVEENIGEIFVKSEGAIIFPGEKYGLHNRVFITSKGNPTYEAKEMGITKFYQELFPFNRALHVVASEQIGFFEVTNKALSLLDPKILGTKVHIPYGLVRLSTGKMSSRLGNIVSVEDLVNAVKTALTESVDVSKLSDSDVEKIALSAIKFAYLKYNINSDITYDLEQSISLQGDSGPYLLYTYVRTESILKKASTPGKATKSDLNPEERAVLQQLEYLGDSIQESTDFYQINLVCDGLIHLAKAFNLFYQKHQVLGSDNEAFRLELTKAVGNSLKKGLNLLGIAAPEKM